MGRKTYINGVETRETQTGDKTMKTFIQTLGGMMQIAGVGFASMGLAYLIASDLDVALAYGLMAIGNTLVGIVLTDVLGR